MSGLRITEEEIFYHRKQFYENLLVHGLPCKIHSIKNNHEEAYDFYNDIDETESYDDSIFSYITYELLPPLKTLKSLGWFIEGEAFPAIGYIPVLYIDQDGAYAAFSPKKDDKIEIVANTVDGNETPRMFLLKDFVGNGFPNVIYYTCNIVPLYQETV